MVSIYKIIRIDTIRHYTYEVHVSQPKTVAEHE